MNRPTHANRARGFTLVELLVVIAVIVLLMALAFPMLQSGLERAYRVGCMSNERQLMHATLLYAGENGGYLPHPSWAAGAGWFPNWAYLSMTGSRGTDLATGAIWPYLGKADVYRCPADPGPWNCNASLLSSYVMNGAVWSYGSCPWFPANCGSGGCGTTTVVAVKHSWRLFDFRANDVCYWEADEANVGPCGSSNVCNGS